MHFKSKWIFTDPPRRNVFYNYSPLSRRKLSISLSQSFLKMYSPTRKGHSGEGNYEKAEKVTKIKLAEYWSQDLINFSSFTPFTYFILVTVLLYHNLQSNMRNLKFLELN